MKWKNLLLASLLTTGMTGFVHNHAYAATPKMNKDITPPAVPIFKINKYINLTNEASFEVKGKGESNSKIHVAFNDGKTTISLNGKTDAKGNFKLKANTEKLIEGKVAFSIQNVDKAGNKSKTKTANLVKDITLEEMSIDNEGFINSLTQNEYPISGTADIGSKVEVSLQSGKTVVKGTGIADELGNYSVEMDTTSLKDGNVKITIKQADAAGNSETQSVEVVKDTKAPSNPILFEPTILQSENVTNYLVNGLGVPNGEVEVTLTDGLNEVSSIGTTDENGLFVVEFNAASLLDGEITITAKQMNEAGNVSSDSTITTKKDTKAPAKPILDTLTPITSANQAEFIVSGQGESGATIQLWITDGFTTISNTGLVDEVGKFTIKLNLSSLKAGNITIIANQIDAVKNIGALTTSSISKQ